MKGEGCVMQLRLGIGVGVGGLGLRVLSDGREY